jgi:hypothetical protein
VRQQGIYGSCLHAFPTALISQLGRINVIFSVRDQQWQRRKMTDDLTVRTWYRESLQEFLQHQSSAIDGTSS